MTFGYSVTALLLHLYADNTPIISALSSVVLRMFTFSAFINFLETVAKFLKCSSSPFPFGIRKEMMTSTGFSSKVSQSLICCAFLRNSIFGFLIESDFACGMENPFIIPVEPTSSLSK